MAYYLKTNLFININIVIIMYAFLVAFFNTNEVQIQKIEIHLRNKDFLFIFTLI